VFAADLGGGVHGNALCGICRVDWVSAGCVVKGCEDLPFGIASDEATALLEGHQAVHYVVGHWTSDHVTAYHDKIRDS
jgi:hypothetical protein